jgi:hypothetical protein
MTTEKLTIAFPEVGIIRKGGQKQKRVVDGQEVETVGKDLSDRFRVAFYPCTEDIAARFFNIYDTFTPHHICAMIPFRSVWDAWSRANEAYNFGRLIARADDDRFITLRDPLSGEYIVRNGEPRQPYTPGASIDYERKGKQYRLKLRPTGRLRLFLPEICRLVMFTLKTTSFYDCLNIEQHLGALQAIADALNGGNVAGIPIYVYRAEREVTWNRPDGEAQRVAKWLVHIEPDSDWVKAAIRRLADFALTGEMRLPLLPEQPGEVTGNVDPEQDEEIDVDSELSDAGAPAQPAPEAQPDGLIYNNGDLVDSHNAAEVDAYRAFVGTLSQPPESRQALRAWFAAQPVTRKKTQKADCHLPALGFL